MCKFRVSSAVLPLSTSAFALSLFLVSGLLLACVCRHQLKNPHCHGFYRFFAFVGILWLFVHALPWWHYQLISARQVASLILLCISLALLVSSLQQLRRQGDANQQRRQQALENFRFENTQTLVTSGIYRHIRHPMYSSLLFLNAGLLLKRPAVDSLIIAGGVIVMLYLTAHREERDNRNFFGADYHAYIKRSKMFIPAIW